MTRIVVGETRDDRPCRREPRRGRGAIALTLGPEDGEDAVADEFEHAPPGGVNGGNDILEVSVEHADHLLCLAGGRYAGEPRRSVVMMTARNGSEWPRRMWPSKTRSPT